MNAPPVSPPNLHNDSNASSLGAPPGLVHFPPAQPQGIPHNPAPVQVQGGSYLADHPHFVNGPGGVNWQTQIQIQNGVASHANLNSNPSAQWVAHAQQHAHAYALQIHAHLQQAGAGVYSNGVSTSPGHVQDQGVGVYPLPLQQSSPAQPPVYPTSYQPPPYTGTMPPQQVKAPNLSVNTRPVPPPNPNGPVPYGNYGPQFGNGGGYYPHPQPYQGYPGAVYPQYPPHSPNHPYHHQPPLSPSQPINPNRNFSPGIAPQMMHYPSNGAPPPPAHYNAGPPYPPPPGARPPPPGGPNTNATGPNPGQGQSQPTETDDIHEHWRGRIAPLPGFCSKSVLLPMRVFEEETAPVSAVTEKLADGEKAEEKEPRLLPPASFFGTGYKGPNPKKVMPIQKPAAEPVTKGKKKKGKRSISVSGADASTGSSNIPSAEKENDENKNNSSFRFDKYADSFVPQYLKNVQKNLHPLKPLPALPVFPSEAYLRSFLIPSLINPGLINEKTNISKGLLEQPPSDSSTTSISTPNQAFPALSPSSISPSSSSNLKTPYPISKPLQVPPFRPDTYHAHWRAILRWELDALATQKEQVVLWQRSIRVADWKEAEFVLEVEGIRENHPYLEVGDLVHLREVIVEFEDVGSGGGGSERKVIRGTGSGRAVEGRVAALRKREGLVHIRSQPLREHIWTYVPLRQTTKLEDGWAAYGPDDEFTFRWNVSFVMNAKGMCVMDGACEAVGKVLAEGGGLGEKGKEKEKAKGLKTNLARQWIFPEPEDFLNAPSMKLENGKIREREWVDKGLNDEQRMAVTSVALYQLPVPHLISGPPGTGKTRTVVEAVLQIFRAQPEACVLVCAPSNPATDTLVLRLLKHLKQHEMLRLNDPNRTFNEVPDSIKPYCYVENNVFSIPPFKKLMDYRVVVTCCLDASILVNAQCTNTTLMALEDEVATSLHPHRKARHVVQPHWTHLLIDEAAQGSEPELLIPISVVLPKVYDEHMVGKTFMPQLALCGDVNQLGPIVSSDEARSAELEVSLLERLFERKLYSGYDMLQQQHAYKQKQRTSFASKVQGGKEKDGLVNGDADSGPAGTTVNGNGINGVLNGVSQRPPPYTHLVKNYRSHPAILMPPSAMFYTDRLEPCARNGVISWNGLPNPHLPVKFVGDLSLEESTDERASWFNPGQITTVVEVVKSILGQSSKCAPPLRSEEIGIMAPWREQVWKLRERLRRESYGAVDVGTVEDYQGRESRVVIISCVRSSPRFLDEDRKKGLGLVLERKRMNVAITRAKELLVIIGNPHLLMRDPYWKSFLQFAKRRKLYEGPELTGLEMDGSYISRLELALEDLNDLDAEERGAVLAGRVAKEVLSD